MIARIRAAVRPRQGRHAKPSPDLSWTRDLFGIVRQEEASR